MRQNFQHLLFQPLTQQMLRFGLVGGSAFLIDLLITNLGVALLGWDKMNARLLAFALILPYTFTLNRRYTFKTASKASARQFSMYAGIIFTTMLINLFLYQWVATTAAAYVPLPYALSLGIAIGTGTGMVLNFIGTRVLLK